MPRLVLISDTHGRHDFTVPEGDVLIHAGDLTMGGELAEVKLFDDLLATLPHEYKVVIAGNHDFCFERRPAAARACLCHALYLEDEGTEVAGLRIYGSPWQPWFFNWAFNLPRGESLRKKWALIPPQTDVLVTHGPPHGMLDTTHRGERVGCEQLTARLTEVRPAIHCFGHIHEAAGHARHDGTLYVNTSVCDLRYVPANPPVIVDVECGKAHLVEMNA